MVKFIDKLTSLDARLGDPAVHQQVQEFLQIVTKLETGTVLDTAPNQFGFAPDWLSEKLKTSRAKQYREVDHLLNNVRQFISLQFGVWSLPNLQVAQKITTLYGKSGLEVMAGNALWSAALQQAGCEMVASDSLEWAKSSTTGAKPFFPVKNLAAQEALKQFMQVDFILCSWAPNFGTSDLELVDSWRQLPSKPALLFVGEQNGATNSGQFWSEVAVKKVKAANQLFSSFDFIQEEIFEVQS